MRTRIVRDDHTPAWWQVERPLFRRAREVGDTARAVLARAVLALAVGVMTVAATGLVAWALTRILPR